MEGIPYRPAGIGRHGGISGSTLKLIAIGSMLIDHTAATVVAALAETAPSGLNYSDVQAVNQLNAAYGWLFHLQTVMGMIGRLAFPLFCFLLVEGIAHTRSKWKYVGRMAFFGLVSEIPFDLAFYGQPFYWEHQNVYFTLLIGMLVVIGFQAIDGMLAEKRWMIVLSVIGAAFSGCVISYYSSDFIYIFHAITGSNAPVKIAVDVYGLLAIIFFVFILCVYGISCTRKSVYAASRTVLRFSVLMAGMLAAELLKTDYIGFGVLTIAVMYLFRESRTKSMLSGCIALNVMSLRELPAFLDLALIHIYNGKRGLKLKYVFYIFYPAHLILLYLISYAIKAVA